VKVYVADDVSDVQKVRMCKSDAVGWVLTVQLGICCQRGVCGVCSGALVQQAEAQLAVDAGHAHPLQRPEHARGQLQRPQGLACFSSALSVSCYFLPSIIRHALVLMKQCEDRM
jgi:hypothetical protein